MKLRKLNPLVYVGSKHNCLVVSKFLYEDNGIGYWECICECGNKKVAYDGDLLTGHIRSCDKCRDNE